MDSNCEILFHRRWREDYPRDIYSNTKSFVGAAVGMAICDNKLSVESRLIILMARCLGKKNIGKNFNCAIC